jgi:ferric iron reductase protein FhuF
LPDPGPARSPDPGPARSWGRSEATEEGPSPKWPRVRASEASAISTALARAGARNPLLTFAPAGADTGISAAEFGAAVPALLGEISAWLGVRERRVAASLVVLGYSARLVGPPVAVLLRDGILLDTRPAAIRFGFAAGAGFRIALVAPRGWTDPFGATGDLAERLRRDLFEDHLAGVISAVRIEVPVAAGLLWGNVASGLLGALAALARDGAAPVRRCADLAAALLADEPLAGTGEPRLDGEQLSFRRRSCCLYYRLPGGGYCGDCCFTGKPAEKTKPAGKSEGRAR